MVNNTYNLTPEGRIGLASNDEYETTTSTEDEEICGPLAKPYLLIVSVGPCLVAIENLVFLFAVLLYRRKLKHNNVYTYVTSALVANVLTSLWAFYHFLNYYYGIESAKPTFWWAFRKGMTVGFSLILCGNIGLLIYAIEDNTYMVGRLVSGTITSRSNSKLNRKARWRKALMLITFVWITPVAYGLLAMTPWNCTEDCTCTLHLSSGAPLCKGDRCSHIYTPMSKIYLLVIVLIWFLECSFLLFVICKAAVSFPKKTNRQTNRCDAAYQESSPDPSAENNNSVRKVSHLRRLSPRMAQPYKFPFILLGLFIVCTTPVMMLLVLDWAVASFSASNITINLVTPMPMLYCIISPILLTKRLSGMRSAIMMALSFAWIKGGWSSMSGSRSKRSRNGKPMRSSVASITHSEDKIVSNESPDMV